MSFDLFVFERRENLKTSEDVVRFMEAFTRYEEEKDYDSLAGCSETISVWARKMFEKFPPMNGEYAPPDEEAFATEESGARMTDYSLGKHGVYCAFSWPASDEALEYVISTLDEYNVGMYNPQSNDAIRGKDIEILKYRTESSEDVFCDWDNIETSLETIDSVERGSHGRNPAFITVWFEKNGKEGETYIQCSPLYKRGRFLEGLFGKQKQNTINGYVFEIMKDNELYQTYVEDKQTLASLMKAWCVDRKEPDISSWEKIL